MEEEKEESTGKRKKGKRGREESSTLERGVRPAEKADERSSGAG